MGKRQFGETGGRVISISSNPLTIIIGTLGGAATGAGAENKTAPALNAEAAWGKRAEKLA